MNFGDCPYDDCSGLLELAALPERTPVYQKTECETCGREVWRCLSRVDPTAWTESEFLEEHEVDERTRTIRRKV